MRISIYILLIVFGTLWLFSCTKESFITTADAEISTSADSLHFDTVFTTTGSVTQLFKVYNKNNRKLLISSISLSGGSNSFFKINADGMAGPEVTNIEMAANDSLYVFVTVKVDQTNSDLPFIVEDSIRIRYNGNEQWVQLQAWGQNANFLRSVLINTNTVWTNEKPYVITGGLLIAENVTLSIEKGTKIYLHADAPLLVDGTLQAVGEKYDSTKIIFQGDRLDDPYRGFPGAWPGIYFRDGSKNNLLQHVIIRNAYQGIVAENPAVNSSPKLTMENCIIDNCYDAGIIGVESAIDATNCLISNCGKNIVLLKGGNYSFTHCTDVAISNSLIPHKQPVMILTNFIKNGDNVLSADLHANFLNCIFWGDNGTVEDEVVASKEGSNVFEVDFQNCLWKLNTAPANITSSDMISNQDPMFVAIDTRTESYDFRLKEGSPAINSGVNAGIPNDLDDNPRTVPDIGAYERQ